jgi:RNA polymerase sigma-70 factor (ECF subfamily)
VRDGDLSAFEAIVRRHRAAVVALAAGRLGSIDDAEDVAQDAFVQAFFRLHQLREPEALLPWLRRLTDRLALMRLRQRREEPIEPGRVEQMQPDREAAGPGASADAGTALRALPDAMRQTVMLTYVAGYTCAETASLLGVREGTVKSRLSRARALMKEALEMTEHEMAKSGRDDTFVQETIDRLMGEARRLAAQGDIDGAAARANEVLDMQTKQLFESGDPTQRRRDCEANAAQYGARLDDLDWELAEVDVLEMTLGKPAGHGNDVWGVPQGSVRSGFKDSRDICRRLRCSPLKLSEWVESGCPTLRCWPFVRFDLDRVRQWLKDNGIDDWPQETDDDLDYPIRMIFRSLYRRELTPEDAERVIESLGKGDWA